MTQQEGDIQLHRTGCTGYPLLTLPKLAPPIPHLGQGHQLVFSSQQFVAPGLSQQCHPYCDLQ